MKQHFAGMSGQINSCKKVSHDIRHRMQELLKDIQEKKKSEDLNEAYNEQIIEEEVQEVLPSPSVGKIQVQSNKRKRKANVEISSYFAPRTIPGSQPTIKSVSSSKEAIHKAQMAIAR